MKISAILTKKIVRLRFALGAPLNEPQVPEFYAGGAKGYTDYPNLPQNAQRPDLNSSHARVNARVSSGV